jgi:hypothetical protein
MLRLQALVTWHEYVITMSLAYVATMSRGEVPVLVSLFSIHMSKLYK